MYASVDAETAIDTVRAAYATGVRYFDTAPLYGHGSSEERLGIALRTINRGSVVVSTKVGRRLEGKGANHSQTDIFVGAYSMDPVFDFSYSGTMESIGQSVRRMGVESIDIALIHDPDEGLSTDGTLGRANHFDDAMTKVLPALTKLREQRVIKAIGVGMNQCDMLCDFAATGKFDCFLLAGRYTLLDHSALERLLPMCTDLGISIILGGAYNSGILATGPTAGAHYNYTQATPELLDRTRTLQAACTRHGITLQAAALQFPMAHPCIATVVVGARSPAEAIANAKFAQEEIPVAFWDDLKELNLIPVNAPTPSPHQGPHPHAI
jgi:D-threo-aldose 1-dehydrogenase